MYILDVSQDHPHVLTETEDERLASCLVQMADMGFGLNRETVMCLAFKIVDVTQRKHPFKEQKAGHAWFMASIAAILSYPYVHLYLCHIVVRGTCMQTWVVLTTFLESLVLFIWAIEPALKTMQIYNCDETGVSVVHKPGKIVAEIGRHKVYAITSAEKGKTHTILTCVSASSHGLPPMMIFSRKQIPPANFREGAIAQTLFANNTNGWVNNDFFAVRGSISFWQIVQQPGRCCSLSMRMELTCQLS